jgi:hypothetical protein
MNMLLRESLLSAESRITLIREDGRCLGTVL